jgi:hypothetical protein
MNGQQAQVERECKLTPRRQLLGGGLTFLSDFVNGLKLMILRESVLFSLLAVLLLPRCSFFLPFRPASSTCLRVSAKRVEKFCSLWNEGLSDPCAVPFPPCIVSGRCE